MRIELTLSCSGQPDVRRRFEQSEIIIGRDPDADFSLPDIDSTCVVSAVHLRLFDAPDGHFAEDTHSTNGTFFEGKRLSSPVRISQQGRFQLGPNGPVITIKNLTNRPGHDGDTRTDETLHAPRVKALAVLAPVLLLIWAFAAVLPSANTEPVAGNDASEMSADLPSPTLLTDFEAQDDSVSLNAGQQHLVDVLGNDGTAAIRGRLRLSSITSSALGAEVALSADRRSLSYTMPVTASGNDQLSYTAVDPVTGATGTAQLSIRVLPGRRDLEMYEDAVSWIGFRFIDEIHADECGWFASSTHCVTSARAATALQRLADESEEIELIVKCDGRFASVNNITIHPGYNAAEPGSRESLASDVAVLQLREPVSLTPCVIADTFNMTQFDRDFRLIGFENNTEITDLYDVTRVIRKQKAIRPKSAETSAASARPILKTDAPFQRGLSGAPVFNDQAEVVGIVSQFAGNIVVVPYQSLRELLPQ